MTRRDFLKFTGLAGCVVATLPGRAQSVAAATTTNAPAATISALNFTTAPSLQNPSATGATVAIGVSGPSTAWVEYGETEALGNTAFGARHGLRPYEALVHHVRLDGLRPGRRCFYRVRAAPIEFRTAYDIRRGDPIATEVRSFRPFDPEAREARFVAWNDTHENAATLAALMERTLPLAPDFLIWNGDVTNDTQREDRMAGQYLNPGGQPFTAETPLIFVRGNHDTRGAAARLLPRYVAVPDGNFFYSFRHGPLAGLVLDMGEDKPDTHPVYAGLSDFVAYRRKQTAWLEQELKQPHVRKAKFRVVFCHIPLARRQDTQWPADDARADWHRLLVKGHVAAVISGHTHQHAVLPPTKARPYAQIIGGGPKPEGATLIHGHVTQRQLRVALTNLSGRELGAWVAG